MTENAVLKTQVDLNGLLEVLGKNLYSEPSVALREIIQNASDACERHRLESGEERDYRIQLTGDPDNGTLIVQDNGSGLTQDEIIEFLATIGTGYSRLLRDKTGTEEVIGYFGLGFLSAYVIASKVEVITTSYKTPDRTWKFSSLKGQTYSVSATEHAAVGTSVVLILEPEFNSLADPHMLTSLVQRYCCLLPINITLNGGSERINDIAPPWLEEAETSKLQLRKKELEFATVFEHAFEPLACIRIPKDNDLGLRGLIWIQDGASYASSDNRNISLFIRNMFITNTEKELLPRWAGFCGAVLESAKFKPTASRESLQKDEYFYEVIDYIHEQLVTGIRRIVLEEPETWRRIQARHNDALLGAAISDDRLFQTTLRSLKVPTTDGNLTLPQLLKKGDGEIYLKPGSKSGHEEILFRVRGNPLVKGYLYAASDYCRRYAEAENTPIHILGTSAANETVFPDVKPESDQLSSLISQLFEDENHEVHYSSFDPPHIPLIVMEDQEVVTKNNIEEDEADKRISSAVLSLARLHTSKQVKRKERVVYINLKNEIIQSLPSLPLEKREPIGAMLTSLMAFLCLDSAQEDQGLDRVFEKFHKSILTFL